jgi:hypothetical protein
MDTGTEARFVRRGGRGRFRESDDAGAFREGRMLWVLTAIAFVAATAALLRIMFVKRSVRVAELGSVSDRWIAEHPVDPL